MGQVLWDNMRLNIHQSMDSYLTPYLVSIQFFNTYSVKWAASWENQQSAYAKTKTQISFAVTAKLISAFVFATWIVQSLYFLNAKFQASSHLQWRYSLVCVKPGQNPHCWFSRVEAQMSWIYWSGSALFAQTYLSENLSSIQYTSTVIYATMNGPGLLDLSPVMRKLIVNKSTNLP